MTGPPAGRRPTGRGAQRRRAIVVAAAELFARRGYPAVGMDDIGAAAGVTGPAIYRHFDSKAAVLAAVIDGIIDAVDSVTATASGSGRRASGPDGPGPAATSTPATGLPVAGPAVTPPVAMPSITAPAVTDPAVTDPAVTDPAAQLAAQVTLYATGVAQRRELMAVFVREVHHLPDEHAERLRHRQRELVARWRTLLAAAHPNWPAERVRTSVHAVFGMLNAVGTFASPLGDEELAGQLAGLAFAALQLPAGAAAGGAGAVAVPEPGRGSRQDPGDAAVGESPTPANRRADRQRPLT